MSRKVHPPPPSQPSFRIFCVPQSILVASMQSCPTCSAAQGRRAPQGLSAATVQERGCLGDRAIPQAQGKCTRCTNSLSRASMQLYLLLLFTLSLSRDPRLYTSSSSLRLLRLPRDPRCGVHVPTTLGSPRQSQAVFGPLKLACCPARIFIRDKLSNPEPPARAESRRPRGWGARRARGEGVVESRREGERHLCQR